VSDDTQYRYNVLSDQVSEQTYPRRDFSSSDMATPPASSARVGVRDWSGPDAARGTAQQPMQSECSELDFVDNATRSMQRDLDRRDTDSSRRYEVTTEERTMDNRSMDNQRRRDRESGIRMGPGSRDRSGDVYGPDTDSGNRNQGSLYGSSRGSNGDAEVGSEADIDAGIDGGGPTTRGGTNTSTGGGTSAGSGTGGSSGASNTGGGSSGSSGTGAGTRSSGASSTSGASGGGTSGSGSSGGSGGSSSGGSGAGR